MLPTLLSSGDLVADRRYDYATALAESGDHAAAAELIEQALDLVPGWAAGWFALGGAREKAGDPAGARAAFAEALRLDPADPFGAGLHIARLDGAHPPAPPPAYVRGLFDAYADDFEAALVGSLEYRAPGHLAAAIEAAAPGRRFRSALDLGCGTGLMARAIADRCARIDGVDLSDRMVSIARRTGLYGAVETGDVTAALDARAPASLDLAVAADVFCYLGDLEPVVAAAARALAPGGILAFSLERAAEDERAPWVLRDSLRFAHTRNYIASLPLRHGFNHTELEVLNLRRDRGNPIAGILSVFTKM